MESSESRLTLIEQDLLRLAEKVAQSEKHQDRADVWMRNHDREHYEQNTQIINKLSDLSVKLSSIESAKTAEETQKEKRLRNRKDTFDRIQRTVTTVIIVVGAFFAAGKVIIDYIRTTP